MIELQKKIIDELSYRSPLEFSLTLNLNGKQLSWEKFPWLPTILKDQSREIVFQKSSQMGVSTAAIIWLLWLCKTKRAPLGIGYWVPTGDDVSDFVRSKFDDFVKENDELRSSIFEDNKEPNNIGMKKIWGTQTYWRGLKSKSKVKSISLDACIFDELDECDPAQVAQAEKRMAASNIKLIRRLSVPTIPEYAINAAFLKTDQCHFGFKCEGCSNWNILEETFPHCLKQDVDGNYRRVCVRCGKEIDITKGTWIAKQRSDIRGYQISSLYTPFISPNDIMKEYLTTEFMNHFHSHVLGLPYLSATDKVNSDHILTLCDKLTPRKDSTREATAMGIDQGSKLHCVVLEPKENRMIWCGELTQFEELDSIMLKFNVKELVIDALPETRKARELMMRHKFKVWLCFYNDNQKGSYAWKEDERIVSVNRTESLDVGTNDLLAAKIKLPRRDDMVELFAKHCSNIVKTVEEDSETRSRKYVYKAIAADHFRHALNYAQIAASRLRTSRPISVMR